MIRYIASDLDGTLLPDNGKDLNPRIFEMILKLKEKGIYFIAASGRQYQSMRRLFAPVQDDISYICENGSLCIKDRQVISRGEIDRELGLRILEAGQDFNRTYGGCNDLISCESRHYTTSLDPRYLHHMRHVICNEIEVIDDPSTLHEPFLKLAFCDFNGNSTLAKYMTEHFAAEIQPVTSSVYWLDFLAPNANKGIALANLLQSLAIDPKDGIAFGDQFNDVDMLKLAGTAYVMKTCAPGMQSYADHVIENVPDVLGRLLGI